MQQVTNRLNEDIELSYGSHSFKYVREFFFLRLPSNFFFPFLDSLIVFVSHSNILLGRDGEGTSSNLTLMSYWGEMVRDLVLQGLWLL